MRLVVATPLYPPEIGGPATYTREIEQLLPSRGWEVNVVPFSVVRGYPKLIRHIAYAYRVFRATKGAQAILVQDTVSCGLPALIAARLRGAKFLVRVPGDYAWEQARQRFGILDGIDAFQGRSYGLEVSLLRAIQSLVVRSANVVIVPSEYFKHIVSGWGVADTHLRVIYNGIHLPLESQAPAQPVPSPFIVSAGRLVPWKGFTALLTLLVRLSEWRLVIIGDGPERKQLEAKARELGVSERIRFLGTLPRAEWVGWCKAAQVFVLNTSFESFSFQVVEAMASGTPVIATNVGSLPELITSGVEGVLVTPDDQAALESAIQSVTTDQTSWALRTSAAKAKAELFTVEKTADALARELQAVLV